MEAIVSYLVTLDIVIWDALTRVCQGPGELGGGGHLLGGRKKKTVFVVYVEVVAKVARSGNYVFSIFIE